MTEILETVGRYRVRLEVQEDQQDSNPRTDRDCNLANVITLSDQRYIDVDKDGGPLQDGWDYFADRDKGVELFIRWARMVHSALAVEENPHDGAHSIWYVMPERIAEAGTTVPPEEIIRQEVEEYREWAAGEVYGHVIEKSVRWQRTETTEDEVMVTWEEVDSCWGYIGYEYAKEEALQSFVPYRAEAQA